MNYLEKVKNDYEASKNMPFIQRTKYMWSKYNTLHKFILIFVGIAIFVVPSIWIYANFIHSGKSAKNEEFLPEHSILCIKEASIVSVHENVDSLPQLLRAEQCFFLPEGKNLPLSSYKKVTASSSAGSLPLITFTSPKGVEIWAFESDIRTEEMYKKMGQSSQQSESKNNSTNSQTDESNPYLHSTLPTGSCICDNALGALQLCPVFTGAASNPYAQAAIQGKMENQNCFVTDQNYQMSSFTNFQDFQGGILKFVNPNNGKTFFIYKKEIQD